jgi:ABC-type xylose transport system substrate-binding protein
VGRAGHQGRARGRRRQVHLDDAKSSAETQATDVENLISQGAKVLIILAQDGTAIKPSVEGARPASRSSPTTA